MQTLLEAYTKYQLGCPDEPNFNEIYLESRDVQLAVFERNPDVSHCELLEHNARACVGCAKNPREGEKSINNEFVEENAGFLGFIFDICGSNEAGLLVPSDLHPCHAKWVQIATKWMNTQRDKNLAAMIGYETAKIVGRIFSGNKG